MRLAAVMWAALVIVAGVAIFMVSYRVQDLQSELQAKRADIEHARTSIRVLEAEWAYLNDPDRLRRLSEQHLGLVAPTASAIATFDRLPIRVGDALPASTAAPEIAPALSSREPVPTVELSAADAVDSFSLDRVKSFLAPVWNGPGFLRTAFRGSDETP